MNSQKTVLALMHIIWYYSVQLLTLWCESLEEGDENHWNILNICTKSRVDGNKRQFQQMDKKYLTPENVNEWKNRHVR